MEQKCNIYTSEEISRFIDHELSEDQYRLLEQHLFHCTVCSRLVEQFRSISDVFCDHAQKKTILLDTASLKKRFEKQEPNSKTPFSIIIPGPFSKNIILKLAAITAIVTIGLFSFQDRLFKYASGPSAIVKSLNTDYASVMIIETQKKKHTIIWFSET